MESESRHVYNQLNAHPARPDQAEFFFALSPETDQERGAVGHLRIDFGGTGNEWWSTWHQRGTPKLNSPSFKQELDNIVNWLRQDGGPLHDLPSMENFCLTYGGEIDGGWQQNYGYILESENFYYFMRCNPVHDDYQCYLNCFDKVRFDLAQKKAVIGRISFTSGETEEFTDTQQFLTVISEELPFVTTTGFQYEILNDDPSLKRAADQLLLDFYGDDELLSPGMELN